MPSLIAAGQKASADATPLAARCDMYWPQYDEAASNLQYIYLEDTLVAPIYDTSENVTSRTVWIPPGEQSEANPERGGSSQVRCILPGEVDHARRGE